MPSSHLRRVFNPEQQRAVARHTERIRREVGADIVVVRGLSGTLAASAMSAMFATPFAVVRKPNEQSHGRRLELVDEYDFDDRTYNDWIIVDDLIASGNTIREIREAVMLYGEDSIKGKCKGIVLYHSDWSPQFEQGDFVAPVFYIGDKIGAYGDAPSKPGFVTVPPPGAFPRTMFDYAKIESSVIGRFLEYAPVAP